MFSGYLLGILVRSTDKDTSNSNWIKFEKAYSNLPPKENPKGFYPLNKDKIKFYSLSEHRQEYIIASITDLKGYSMTVSRPFIFLEEALKDGTPESLIEKYSDVISDDMEY